MEDETKNLLTETAKIRFYIMNLIFRNGNQSVKIMSTRALAEQFDVARGTVRAAVEKMVEEKYLITRRGIGTFTNPSKAFCRLQKVPPKLIGIKMQGGDQFFLDPPAMRTLAALLEAFSRRNFIVRFLNGSAERGEDSVYELEHAYVDGIVACDAPCAFLRAAGERVPTVSINLSGEIFRESEPFVQIRIAWNHAVKTAAELLGERTLFVCREAVFPTTLAETFSAQKIKMLSGKFEELRNLPELPGGVILAPEHLADFHQLLQSRGTSWRECRPFLLTQPSEPLPCWCFASPREAAFRRSAEALDGLLNGGFRKEDFPPETLEYELIEQNQ
ncbi:MAG: GntR family transcriptional regulator [bacterium]|nr:GntR family transcriptional regulator [bacterium]